MRRAAAVFALLLTALAGLATAAQAAEVKAELQALFDELNAAIAKRDRAALERLAIRINWRIDAGIAFRRFSRSR